MANNTSSAASSNSLATTNNVTSALSSSTTTSAATNAAQPFQSASLYVGDIHPDVTEALLFEIFNAVGPVASIRVCRDAVTRRSLGYAYVNFHNVADAERALDTMNYTTIKNVPCRIMWSQRDPSLRKSGLGNIFVRNLDVSIDNKALYDTFSLFGNILSCKVVNDGTGNSKGYGYVHYETQEPADEAIEKINGMLIAGQEVFVGAFQKRQERPDDAKWTNCYVKNIPRHWDEDKLRSEFQPFGEITSCVIMKDKSADGDAVASRGFGFVNFEDPDAAVAAMEALNGRTFKSEDESADVELFVGKAQKKGERERELRQKFEALKMERITKYQGVNLYVKNIDDKVSEEMLREAFAPFGTITSVRVMNDEHGNSKGFGFVCFATPDEATKAVTEMNGKLLNQKPIYVALAQRKEVRRAQLEAQHAQQRVAMPTGRGGMPMQPPMFGAAPMFYAQPNQMPPHPHHHQAAVAAGRAAGGAAAFVYPQQMMRGGAGAGGNPRGVAGAGGAAVPPGAAAYTGGRGGAYQLPPGAAYGIPPTMQQRPPRGGSRRTNHGGGRGGPQQQPHGGGITSQAQQHANHHNSRNFKYTANARNHPQSAAAAAAGMTPPHHQMMNPNMPHHPQLPNNMVTVQGVVPPPVEPLTSAVLANATEEQQKNMIGERLYPLIHQEQPALAGKITGMLLEMDNGELLVLLESPEALTAKIQEALQVLEAHNNNGRGSIEAAGSSETQE